MSFQKAQWTSVPGFIGSETWWHSTNASCCGTGSPRLEAQRWKQNRDVWYQHEATRVGSLISTSWTSWTIQQIREMFVAVSRQVWIPWVFLCSQPSVRLPSELVDVGFKPTGMIGEACKCWDPQIQWNIAEKIWNTKFGEETNYTQATFGN